MAVVSFVKVTEKSEGGSNQVTSYLDSAVHAAQLRELCRSHLLTEQNIGSLSDCLNDKANLLYLESVKLPKDSLTANFAARLAQIIVAVPSIKELDLSENAVRTDGLSYLVEEALTLSNCQVTTLNLADNKLGSKGTNALANLLRGNSSIQTLLLGHNTLGAKPMKTLSQSLKLNSSLRHLDLTQNKLGDRGANLIAEILDPKKSPYVRLETLDLSNNKISYTGAYHLADAFIKGNNNTLKVLKLGDNCIEAEGAEAFGVVLRFSHTLLEVNLSRNNIGDRGVLMIAKGLKENEDSQLRRLDLSWNGIKDEGAYHLADMLTGNSVLTFLNLRCNFICDRGIRAIAEALPSDMALEELDLVGNQMRDPSALIDALCHHDTKLQRLRYEQNHLSDEAETRLNAAFKFRENKNGWFGKLLREIKEKKLINCDLSSKPHSDEEIIALSKQLAKYGRHGRKVMTAVFGGPTVTPRGIASLSSEVLARNTAVVQRLYIQNSPIRDLGAESIGRGLGTNTTLRCLCLTKCGITENGARMIANALQRNMSLTRLSLEGNKIGSIGFQDICKAILKDRPHPSLVALNVSDNEITDDGMCFLANLFQLEELHLDGNPLTDRGALDLAKVIMGNTTLRWLNIRRTQVSWKGVQTLKLFLPGSQVLDADSEKPVHSK